MDVEVRSRQLKNRLSRHAKKLLVLLLGFFVLLLYLTTLLSQATALSDTFVDIAIYTLYLLLISILGSMTFIAYCVFEEKPLIEVQSYRPKRDLSKVENRIVRPVETLPKTDEDAVDYGEIIMRAKKSFPSEPAVKMQGFAAVATSETEKIALYLSQQHPQIAAVTLLVIEVDKAADILEHIESAVRDDLLVCITGMQSVSHEAVKGLNSALQRELIPSPEECSGLRTLESETIRTILRQIDKKELMFALKGMTQELQDKFFANMSSKASAEFKKALTSVSVNEPIRSRKAIKNLCLLAERLRENGRIRATNKAMG